MKWIISQENVVYQNDCIKDRKFYQFLQQKQRNLSGSYLPKATGLDGFTGEFYQTFFYFLFFIFPVILNMFIFKYVPDNKIESMLSLIEKQDQCLAEVLPWALWLSGRASLPTSFYLAARGCTFFGKTLPPGSALGTLLVGVT